MAEIKHATDANFEELVLKSERPVVVDFWAAWCGPCKMVAPEMEKLAAKYDGAVDVVKVDVDANPRLSQAFNILSIPTIAFFKPGAQPQGVVGFRPLEQLEQQFGLTEFAAVKPRTDRDFALALDDPGPPTGVVPCPSSIQRQPVARRAAAANQALARSAAWPSRVAPDGTRPTPRRASTVRCPASAERHRRGPRPGRSWRSSRQRRAWRTAGRRDSR